jgi:nitroimidazol reductase NimA-like FMN-containing flavoprotein (pyridoxamine 5'-phosphate oxidase superfamily)
MRRKDREVSDIGGIEEILLQCKTCHVAMIDDGLPYVVPLSYGYKFLGGRVLELYFHSAPEGKKLDVLKQNNKVCFAISNEGEPTTSETPCNSGYYYASVIGYGEAHFVESADERCNVLSIIFKHQAGKDVQFTPKQSDGVCVFKIISTDYSGKKRPRRARVPTNN